MATASTRGICVTCKKEKITYQCQGCSTRFCLNHLSEHQTNLRQQHEQIQHDRDRLRQELDDQRANPTKHLVIKQVDQWEKNSIDKIKQTAEQFREKWMNYSDGFLFEIEKKLNYFAQQMKNVCQENVFNEIDLNHIKQNLEKLRKILYQTTNIPLLIKQQSTSLITNISLRVPIHRDTQWKQFGRTIAGGKGLGNRLDQLSAPFGICIDDQNQTIYIADYNNARILEYKLNGRNARIVAGGNGPGNQTNQLCQPTDVIIDRQNISLIIADSGNRRVMRWFRPTTSHGQIIISDIDCWGLTMHKDGSLYISDCVKNEVRRWKKGVINETIVARSNGQGNQLHYPTYLFVDDDYTLYVSDRDNHRVIKWMKDGKEAIVVAGGNGRGDHVTQLSYPRGVLVDQFGRIYVTDCGNDRVMRWCEGETEGTIVVGDNRREKQANQLSDPMGLSFDRDGNLYVADMGNHRIQKYEID